MLDDTIQSGVSEPIVQNTAAHFSLVHGQTGSLPGNTLTDGYL